MSKRLGEILKKEREVKRASLRDVEAVTDISNAYLYQMESGKIAEPSPNVLHKLATYYKISYATLLEAAGYVVPKEATGSKPSGNHALLLRERDLEPDEEQALSAFLEHLRAQKAASKKKG